MSDYNKATDFAAKDALTSGDPDKIIKGTPIDDEFNSIAVAVATKADRASPTFSGTVTMANLTVSGTVADLGAVTTADINGGTMDNVVIGATTAVDANFDNVYAGYLQSTEANITGEINANTGTSVFTKVTASDVVVPFNSAGAVKFADADGVSANWFRLQNDGGLFELDVATDEAFTGSTNVFSYSPAGGIVDFKQNLGVVGEILADGGLSVGTGYDAIVADNISFGSGSLAVPETGYTLTQVGITHQTTTNTDNMNRVVADDAAAVLNNQVLGGWEFYGDDDTGIFSDGGYMKFSATQAWTLAGGTGARFEMGLCEYDGSLAKTAVIVENSDSTTNGLGVMFTGLASITSPIFNTDKATMTLADTNGGYLVFSNDGLAEDAGLSYNHTGTTVYLTNNQTDGSIRLTTTGSASKTYGTIKGAGLTSINDGSFEAVTALPGTTETDTFYFIV